MIYSVHKSLARAKKHLKAGDLSEAEKTYCEILAKFPKNKKAIQGYQRLKSGLPVKASSGREPPKEQVRELIELYKAGKFEETLAKSAAMKGRATSSLGILGGGKEAELECQCP